MNSCVMFFTIKLGVPPTNIVAHAQQLSAKSFLLSALGSDALVQKAITQLQRLKADTPMVQVNKDFATGRTVVNLDPMGNPSCNIEKKSAWGHIQFDTPQKNRSAFGCDLFWNFGTKKFYCPK